MDPTKPFRELLERRLWPVAVLLVAALIAVPLLLSRDAESVAAPRVAASGSDVEPVVAAADPAARDEARRVLGRAKDPFRAAATPTPTATAKSDAGKKGSESGSSGGDAGSGGSGSGDTPESASPTPATPLPTVVPPVTAPTPAPERGFPLHSLEVRFGTVENPDHADRTLSRLSGLPKGTTPALLYLGLKPDRRTAVFLVRDGVAVVGDGTCKGGNGRTECQTLEMRKGDIEFVGTPDGGQYQVEILGVHTRRTSSASAARAARTHTFPGGKAWLEQLDGHSAGLRYDAAAGVLKAR